MTNPWRDRGRTWWRSLGSRAVRATLLVIVVAGGAARVAWVAHAGIPPRFASDPEAYLLQGEAIARGEGYANPLVDIENASRRRNHQPILAREPASFYPPGYPTFIAAVAWTVWHTPLPDGDLVRTIEYVQTLLGALSILLVFLLARRVFSDRAAVLAAAIVAAYPNLITTTATLQFETVFITLTLLTALALLSTTTRRDHGFVRLVANGALIGAVALIHPTICLFIFAFLAARIFMRRPWRETARDFAILTTAMVLVIVPWTIRNVVELHAFVPVATGAGPALCMSRNPEATGALDIGILSRQCAPRHEAPSLTQKAVDANRYSTSHAIQWVVHHPISEVKMWWTRTDLAYRHDTSGLLGYAPNMTSSTRHTADMISDDASFVVLALAAAGVCVTIVKRRRPDSVLLIVATIALAAVPAILFGDPRYRVPAEPFFAVFAAAALGAALELVAPQRAPSRSSVKPDGAVVSRRSARAPSG